MKSQIALSLAVHVLHILTVLAGQVRPSFREGWLERAKTLHDSVPLDDDPPLGSYGVPPVRSSEGSLESDRESTRRNSPQTHREPKPVFYGVAPSLDAEPQHAGGVSSLRDPAVGSREPGLAHEKQVVTGIPDLSDPCFRRYANSIIVNAQPYERSQVGVYSCRSFVYDNVNQVCDLFAHVGDQSPARLLRFQTRDYFEPTAAVACKVPAQQDDISVIGVTAKSFAGLGSEERTTTSFLSAPTTTARPEPPLFNQAVAGVSELLEESTASFVSAPPEPTTRGNAGQAGNNFGATSPNRKGCGRGEVARYLKTSDFELHQHDDLKLDGISLEECVEFCSSPSALKEVHADSPNCNSFEYNEHGVCVLSKETAVPLGNGQLKQKPGTSYFEKVCIDDKLARDCPSAIYNRYPQKILVGFAETVVDAPSLQHCFDNCLNSRQLYGFKCASGMFYFELNCILNTEDRTTQPDLFTSENSDLVDYFETSCNQSAAATRRFAPPKGRGSLKNRDFVEKGAPAASSETLRRGVWTEWSACSGGPHTYQTRRKMCLGNRICGSDRRRCSKGGEEMDIGQIVEQIRTSGCPPDVCCPILGKCFGIIQRSATKRLEWCSLDCKS